MAVPRQPNGRRRLHRSAGGRDRDVRGPDRENRPAFSSRPDRDDRGRAHSSCWAVGRCSGRPGPSRASSPTTIFRQHGSRSPIWSVATPAIWMHDRSSGPPSNRVAENTADAVVSPLLWGAVAGIPGLLGYRAANTLDAMVGHRSPRYENFGWAAARLDDVLNYLPARVCVGLIALVCARGRRAAAHRDLGGPAGRPRTPQPERRAGRGGLRRGSGPHSGRGQRLSGTDREPWHARLRSRSATAGHLAGDPTVGAGLGSGGGPRSWDRRRRSGTFETQRLVGRPASSALPSPSARSRRPSTAGRRTTTTGTPNAAAASSFADV